MRRCYEKIRVGDQLEVGWGVYEPRSVLSAVSFRIFKVIGKSSDGSPNVGMWIIFYDEIKKIIKKKKCQ